MIIENSIRSDVDDAYYHHQSYKFFCESVKHTIIIMIIQSPNRVLSEGSTKNPCRTRALGAVIAVIIIIVIVKALILSIKAIWFHHWFLASILLHFTTLPIFFFFAFSLSPSQKKCDHFLSRAKKKSEWKPLKPAA